MLVHGCIGRHNAFFGALFNSNFIDLMTSKTSTLWLDDDQMQKMIRLIQDAKSKYSNILSLKMTNLKA